MTKWLRRVRAVVLTGLTWALVWAPVAVLIGLFVDPDGAMDEMWPAIGAIPGFLGGVVFAVVLAVAARHRRLDELSLPRVTAWGALAGLLVGVLPFLVGEPTTERPLWVLASVVAGTITLLGAASAAASLALASRAGKSAPLDAAAAVDDVAPHRASVAEAVGGHSHVVPGRPPAPSAATARAAYAAAGGPQLTESGS